MSRSCYDDYCDGWWLIMWRGAVSKAIKGRRGQAFLREMLRALESMPVKELIESELEENGSVCAIGSVGKMRGIDMSGLDPECPEAIAARFGIARAMVQEIEYENDENSPSDPVRRYVYMKRWVKDNIIAPADAELPAD